LDARIQSGCTGSADAAVGKQTIQAVLNTSQQDKQQQEQGQQHN
jgi:hypothetical protein